LLLALPALTPNPRHFSFGDVYVLFFPPYTRILDYISTFPSLLSGPSLVAPDKDSIPVGLALPPPAIRSPFFFPLRQDIVISPSPEVPLPGFMWPLFPDPFLPLTVFQRSFSPNRFRASEAIGVFFHLNKFIFYVPSFPFRDPSPETLLFLRPFFGPSTWYISGVCCCFFFRGVRMCPFEHRQFSGHRPGFPFLRYVRFRSVIVFSVLKPDILTGGWSFPPSP